jgi:hypothetical protein
LWSNNLAFLRCYYLCTTVVRTVQRGRSLLLTGRMQEMCKTHVSTKADPPRYGIMTMYSNNNFIAVTAASLNRFKICPVHYECGHKKKKKKKWREINDKSVGSIGNGIHDIVMRCNTLRTGENTERAGESFAFLLKTNFKSSRRGEKKSKWEKIKKVRCSFPVKPLTLSGVREKRSV